MARGAFSSRVLEPEIMDDPGLEAHRHRAALRALTRINALSASAAILWGPLARLARRLGRDRLRVLDIATGAGDIPIRLWQKAQRSGLKLEIQGIDVSDRALDFARERAAAAQAPLAFTRLDALTEPLPAGFDVVVSSLFLHHLTNDQAAALLRSMAAAAGRMVLVNDLRRGWECWLLAQAAVRVLSRSEVVHYDGPQSVRAAFSLGEIEALAAQAGLPGATVRRRWPCRFLLSWQRADG